MKFLKYKTFLFYFLFLVLFCSCTSNPNRSPLSSWFEPTGKIKILSTTAMIDDLVGEIGKEKVDHLPLIVGEIDPHSYELVKGDDEKIKFATLIIANGLNLEHGASLRYQLKKHSNVLFLGDEIEKTYPEKILIVNGERDPHLWTDISIWAEGIDSIVTALGEQDPENLSYYQKNGEELRDKFLDAHRKIQQSMREIPSSKRYLVTSHDAFHYFTRAYLSDDEKNWQDRCNAPEGLAPEGQLSCKDIQKVVDYLNRYDIEVIFPESNVSPAALNKIISSSNRSVRISKYPLYGDAMGKPGTDADNYLRMVQHNAKVLKEEWSK